MNTPIDSKIVKQKIIESGLPSLGNANIRELKKLVGTIETATGAEFIKMEMGIPGLPPAKVGVEAEIKALRNGVAAIYPNIEGIPTLKKEAALFVKNFMDVEVREEGCIPTVGSMMAGFATFMTMGRMYEKKNKTLFIDPGFPVQKQQLKVMGHDYDSFDVYNFRGKALKEKLESYLETNEYVSLIYSNPNNPTWICFTDEELKIIGELAHKYDVIVIEDLAYFGMDFRKDYTQPGVAPYQPTVAKYTNKFVLFISASKAFSYAGQRMGLMVLSDEVFNIKSEGLKANYGTDEFARALVFGTLYTMSSGTAHSAQYAMAAILKACNDGSYRFRDDVIVYAKKAKVMKKIFIENGFYIVYDKDENEPIADGFYFTIAYPEMTGDDLIKELLYYGVSAISLSITGSKRTEGLRACVSLVREDQFPVLEERLKAFSLNHPIN